MKLLPTLSTILTPARFWVMAFGAWGLILSGASASVFGPPGFLQANRLQTLLETKRGKAQDLRLDVERLRAQVKAIETRKPTQEREIRRVLGYAAPDEMIFEFADGYAETRQP